MINEIQHRIYTNTSYMNGPRLVCTTWANNINNYIQCTYTNMKCIFCNSLVRIIIQCKIVNNQRLQSPLGTLSSCYSINFHTHTHKHTLILVPFPLNKIGLLYVSNLLSQSHQLRLLIIEFFWFFGTINTWICLCLIKVLQ